jgi:hypothetical protein
MTPFVNRPGFAGIFTKQLWGQSYTLAGRINFYRSMTAMRIKASHSKPKPAPAVETSDSINAQIAAFLKSGGEIQQIEKGVSGQTFAPSRQITLGKK